MSVTLLASLVGEFQDLDVESMRALPSEFTGARWPLTALEFVDEIDASSCTREEDLPIRTVGFVLLLPDGATTDDDRRALECTESFVDTLARFASHRRVEVEIEYAGELIGTIVNGTVTKGIAEGLLGEWRRALPAAT